MKKKTTLHFEEVFTTALEHYFEKKYKDALEILLNLQKMEDLTDAQKADLLRRIADCNAYIDAKPELLELYDQALKLAGNVEFKRCWILASKASTFAMLHRYAESFQTYAEAIQLTEDPDDLEHLQDCVYQVISEQENFTRFGDIGDWKQRLLSKVTKKI